MSVCDKDCFNCPYDDCIYDALDAEDYAQSREIDKILSEKKTDRQKRELERLRLYREAHREELRARERERYWARREEISAKRKAFRRENREEVLAKEKAYRRANHDKCLAWWKAYRERNREEISERRKQLYREKRMAESRGANTETEDTP